MTSGDILSSPSGIVGLLCLVVLIPVVYKVVLFVSWARRMRRIGERVNKFPGPPTHWLFGNIHQIPGVNEEGLAFLRSLVQKHNRAHRIWMGPFRPFVTTHHPDTVKTVLRSTEPKPLSGGGGYKLLSSWLGDGLLLSSGSKWFRNRRLLTPAFHFDVLKPYLKVYNEAADKLLDKFEGESKNGSVEVFQPVSLCTLNIILRCAFSSDIDVQGQGKSHPYVQAVVDMAKLMISRTFNPILFFDTLYYLTRDGRKYRKYVNRVHQTSSDLIAQRKQALKENPEFAKKRYPDFLDILLLARDEDGDGLSDQEIQDEVDTFLFEGHDTTASAISWILYELAKNPDHQQRCREEVITCLGEKRAADVQWADLSNLEYTTMCIKEAIRVHSPVPLIGRETSKPFELDGVTLLPGTLVDVSVYLLHHNELVWGEDHMEFKPERFHPDKVVEMDSFAFVPFSAGPRNCIGQNFAMHEIKVVVAKALHRFNMRLDPDHKVKHIAELVMRAEHGLKMFFAQRKQLEQS